MTIRQVLLNGSGTSGDGTTWNDASDATSAYIGSAGFAAAFTASAAGDTIYVKGTEIATVSMTCTKVPPSIAFKRNPMKIYGCKSATTNDQGSIVTSDLIPGKRTGISTFAYDDADVPFVDLSSDAAADIKLGSAHFYGISFKAGDDITISSVAESDTSFEECLFTLPNNGDLFRLCEGLGSHLVTRNCKFDNLDRFRTIGGEGHQYHYGTIFKALVASVGFLAHTSDWQGYQEFHNCVFEGGETVIFSSGSGTSCFAKLFNCKFPTSYVLLGGTVSSIGDVRIEAYGCDDTTGLTTSGSEQQMDIATTKGTIATETTKVRTGGADDGAAGIVSWDISSLASGTTVGITSIYSPWMYIWVAGDGTSKTLTVYFASDTGNTRGTNWNDDEIWMEVHYPDDGGTSQYDQISTLAAPLAAGTEVTDGTDGQWAAGGVRAQELSVSIAPDYEGYVACRVNFAPGANAETIYVDPQPVLS